MVLHSSRSRSRSLSQTKAGRRMGLRKNPILGEYRNIDTRFSVSGSAMARALKKQMIERGREVMPARRNVNEAAHALDYSPSSGGQSNEGLQDRHSR